MRPAIAALIVALSGLAVACGGGDTSNTAVSQAPIERGAAEVTASGGAPTAIASSASVTAGAGPAEKQSGTIKVGAASDLRRVMTTLQPGIEQACNTKLTFVFGSSGQLKEQILAGADYHLYLSADTAFVEELNRAGKLVPNGKAAYGVGRIALSWRAGLQPIDTVPDLGRPDVRRISIANPDHAPYGRAAQQAMTAAGVWDSLRSRLVFGENIRQATDYVQQGNADAGIVALALVIDTETPYMLIEASQHKPIIQAGGIVNGTGGELTARCALQQILDPAGQETLKQFGFEPAPSP